MNRCYKCNEPAVDYVVEEWLGSGKRRRVDTCAKHTRCSKCGKIMEVNPISGRIECFHHFGAN